VIPRTSPTPEQWEELVKNVCGGADSFEIPSKRGVPFELYIRYPKRLPGKGSYTYKSDQVAIGFVPPATAAYNLFTLQADQITFDVSGHVLTGKGNVVVTDSKGRELRSEFLAVELANGQAHRLRESLHAAGSRQR